MIASKALIVPFIWLNSSQFSTSFSSLYACIRRPDRYSIRSGHASVWRSSASSSETLEELSRPIKSDICRPSRSLSGPQHWYKHVEVSHIVSLRYAFYYLRNATKRLRGKFLGLGRHLWVGHHHRSLLSRLQMLHQNAHKCGESLLFYLPIYGSSGSHQLNP